MRYFRTFSKVLMLFLTIFILNQNLSATTDDLKDSSLVTIKIAGKYVSFEMNTTESEKHDNRLYGNVILKETPDRSCVFMVRKSDENNFGFLALNGTTVIGSDHGITKAFLSCENAFDNTDNKTFFAGENFSGDKHFELDDVSGETDTYRLKYVNLDESGYVIKDSNNVLKAGNSGADASDAGDNAKFEIKEIKFEIEEKTNTNENTNTIAQQCLPGFYRADLVTIKSVGKDKYFNIAYDDESDISQQPGQWTTSTDVPTTRGIFKIDKNTGAISLIDGNTIRKELDVDVDGNYWLRFMATNGTTFNKSEGGDRYWLNCGKRDIHGELFAADEPPGDSKWINFKTIEVDDQENTYLIKNQQSGKFYKADDNLLSQGTGTEATALANNNYWFEIKPFVINPNLYLLNYETAKRQLGENKYIKFQVKGSNGLEVKLYDENEDLIGTVQIKSSGSKITINNIDTDIPNITLSDDSFSSFWISTKDGKVRVGTGTDVNENKKVERNLLTETTYFTFKGESTSTSPTWLSAVQAIAGTIEPITLVEPSGTTDDPLPKGLIEIKKLINNVDKYITIKDSNKALSFDLSIESATTANKSRRTLFIEYDESGNKQKIFGSLNPNDYTFHNLDSFAATNENKNSKSIRQGFLSNYNNGCFQTSWYPYFGNDSIKTFNFPETNQYLITTLRAYNTGNTNIYFGIQNGQFKIDLEPTSVDAKLTINTTSAPGADGVEGGDEDDADQLPPTITITQVEQLLTTANTQLQATKAQDAVFTTFGKDYAIKPAFQTKFNNTKTAQTNAKNKLQELLNQETTPPATLPGTTKTSIQDLITEAATILSSVQTSVPDSSSTMPGKQHGEEKLETVQSLLQTAFDSLKTAMITIPEPPPDPQVDTDDVLLPVGFIKISHAQSQNPSLFMTISSKTISDYEYKLLMASPDGTPSTSFKQIFRVIRKKIGTKDRQKILACLDKNYSYNATAETILTNQGFLEEDYFERTHPHDWAYTTIKTLKIKDSTDKYLITTLGQYKDKATNPNIYFGYKNGQFKTDLTKNDTAAQFKIITTNKPEGATVEAGAIIIPKIDQIKSNLEKAKTATTAKNKIESLVASLTIAESVPANQITYEIQSAFFNQLNSLLTEPLLTKVKTEKQVAALRALVTKAITSNLVPINIKIIQYFEGKLPGLVVVKTDLEKMFEQFEKAKTSTTAKEKVEALVAAQVFATPKVVKQITSEKLTEIQTGLDNLVFELLTTDLVKVKTDNQIAALKGVINKLIAPTSKLLPIRSKVLLKLLADSTLKVTPTATPTTPAAIPAQIRGPGGLPPRRTTRGRTTTSLGGRQVGTQQRGRRVIPRR